MPGDAARRMLTVATVVAFVSGCGPRGDVITVDVDVQVEGDPAAVAPALPLSFPGPTACGTVNDGVMTTCTCPYSTDVDLVRLRYSGNGRFPVATGATATVGVTMALRFQPVLTAYTGAPLYEFTPQLESSPDDPPVLVDERATLDGNTVTVRYQTDDGAFVRETHLVHSPVPFILDEPDGLQCIGDCRSGAPLPTAALALVLLLGRRRGGDRRRRYSV